jgi:hypothetical protein
MTNVTPFRTATPTQIRKDERDFVQLKLVEQKTEDLRDDVVSIIKNSKLTFREIHARCGPCPSTLDKWFEKKVKNPRLATIVGALEACGRSLKITQR